MTMTVEYERRYTGVRGKRAHLLHPSEFGRRGHTPRALCGAWAWDAGSWFGSGNQSEYEHAAALPTCKTCERKAQA